MKKIILLVLVLFLIPLGFADLVVESFTCNSQSGTINIENNGAMICQAVMQNTDTQNSVSLNTVTLYVDGNWAEETSYLGTGFSTSVTQGGSTTATFSGIRPVSPGSYNFQSITLDASTDTYVTDSAINSVAFKRLTTNTVVSAGASASIEISSYVMVGGNMDNVQLALSLSGCSLANGETGTKTIGSMSNNAESTRSWQVVMGSANNCDATVTSTGTAGQVVVTKTKSVTITNTDSTTTTVSSGGGGGSSSTGSSSGGGVATTTVSSETVETTLTTIVVENKTDDIIIPPLRVTGDDSVDWAIIITVLGVIVLIGGYFLLDRKVDKITK